MARCSASPRTNRTACFIALPIRAGSPPSARYVPGNATISTAATAKHATLMPNAAPAATANTALASGGPTKSCASSPAPCSRPFAVSNRSRSPTTAGTIEPTALSYTVSHAPSTSTTVYSSHNDALSSATAASSAAITPVRTAPTTNASRRRSCRSTSTPAGNPSTSHGRNPSAASTENATGSLVSRAASNAMATR